MRVPDGGGDAALLDRIAGVNRARLLPVIERVFDAVDRPDRVIRIDRIAVDLGPVDPDDPADIAARLAAALRRALAPAIDAAVDAADAPSSASVPRSRGVPVGTALIEAFEWYLLHGTWPYASAIAGGTRAEACLIRLVADEPAALAAMLRRLGVRIVPRLAAQMPYEALAALLPVLEPVHAAYVLAYLAQVRAAHAMRPVVVATRDAFDTMLATITLADALARGGLQANRKAFLRRLIGGLATASGTPLSALVWQLRRGLRGMGPMRRRPGSLVNLLAEIVGEDGTLATGQMAFFEVMAMLEGAGPRWADGGSDRSAAAGRALVARVLREHPVAMRRLLVRLAKADRAALARRTAALIAPETLVRLTAETGEREGERNAVSRPVPDDAGLTGASALVRLLDAVPPGEIAQVLAQADPVMLRTALRDLALADAVRLMARLADAIPPRALVRMLAPAHQVDVLVLLGDSVAAAWPAVVTVAARAQASATATATLHQAVGVAVAAAARGQRLAGVRFALPEGVRTALRAEVRAARAQADRHAALDRLVQLWRGAGASGADASAMPFDAATRAAAARYVLPGLVGLPPIVVRQRLRGGSMLAALAPRDQLRLAVLLVPRGTARTALAERLRATPAAADRATLIATLVRTGRVPDVDPVEAVDDTAMAITLRSMGTAAFGIVVAAFADDAPLPQGAGRWRMIAHHVARARHDPRARLRDRFGGDPARFTHLLSGVERGDLLVLLRLLGVPDAAAGMDSDALRSAVGRLVVGRPAPRSRIGLAALLRGAPLAAIRGLDRDPAALGQALPTLLSAPEAALLFAGADPVERMVATAFGRLLTGRTGRAAVAPETVARALAATLDGRRWTGDARGFVAAWAAALRRAASSGEWAAVARLIETRWPDAPTQAAARAMLGLDTPRPPPPPPADMPAIPVLRQLVRDRPRARMTAVRQAVQTARGRAAVVAGFGEADLIRMLALLAPAAAASLLHAAERILAARAVLGVALPRAAMWRAMLATVARRGGDVASLAAALLADVAASPRRQVEDRLRRERGLRDAVLRASLTPVEARTRWPPVIARGPAAPFTDGGAIHVGNAGLVLVSAFVPQLFRSLDLVVLGEDGRPAWREPDARERGVHLLQWLVVDRCDAPEPELALAKLLCGMVPSDPVVRTIVPTARETEIAQSLLGGVLANWPALGGTSVAGLRETFLQRDGRLTRNEDGWNLVVERRVLDILIDRLPWGFSMILHPWMPGPIAVEW